MFHRRYKCFYSCRMLVSVWCLVLMSVGEVCAAQSHLSAPASDQSQSKISDISFATDEPQPKPQTVAYQYALGVVRQHIKDERQLSDAELEAVHQIARAYEDWQTELATFHISQTSQTALSQTHLQNQPQAAQRALPKTAHAELVAQLMGLRANIYHYFLGKNFGITYDSPEPATDEGVTNDGGSDE